MYANRQPNLLMLSDVVGRLMVAVGEAWAHQRQDAGKADLGAHARYSSCSILCIYPQYLNQLVID